MSNSTQLKWGVLISYVAIGINIITGLFYTPWMIHTIGRENFGLYTLSLSVITLFLFDFGLSTTVTRFISKYIAEGRQDKANQCYGLVYRLYLVLDIILLAVLVGVYFFIPQIYKELTPIEIEKFKVVYCMTSLYSILSFPFIPLNGILMAYERVIQLKLCDVAHKLIIVGAMSICLISGFGLYALVAVNAISGIITILLKLECVRRYTTQRINWSYYNHSEFKEIVGYSGWITVISFAQRCIFSLAPTILGALSGSTSIAILGIAVTLEGYTYTFANAMNGVFLPKVSRIMFQGNGDVLPLMTRIARLQIYVIGLLVLGIVCFGREFIILWVGKDFTESYLCAILIIAPSLIQLPQEIGLQAIYAKNRVKPLAVVFICMAICSLILSFILAKPFGTLGIGISVFFAYILRTFGMDYILFRDLNINLISFFRDSFGKLIIPLIICLGIGLVISYLVPHYSWYSLIFKIMLFCFSYTIVMYYLAMNDNEKSIILAPVRKIMRIK